MQDARDHTVHGRDVLLVLALTAAVLFALRWLLGGLPRSLPTVFGLLALQSAVPMAILYLLVIRRRGLPWAAVGLRPAAPRWYAIAVGLAFASLPLVLAVNAGLHTLMGGTMRNPQLDVLAPFASSGTGLLMMLVMAGMVAPFVEEVVFRGLLFGWLRPRIGLVVAMLASALAFGAVHAIPQLIPALTLQGLLFAWLYARSDSLWPSIVMHGTFNAVMSLLLYAAVAAGVPLR